MNIIKSIALAGSLALQSASSPASAANVYGFGSIDTNLGPPLESVDTEYEDSDVLDVANTVQLNGSQAGGNIPVGNKDLSFFGDAQFGRLAAASRIGGQVPASPDLSTSVDLSMGFHGDPIPGATFTSTSGYDYITAPVPEPETWALMLAAVATLGRAAPTRGSTPGGFDLPIFDR